jgi:tight adherence protein B
MFVIVAFLLFSLALLIAGYYAFSVPQQQAAQAVGTRLRELRSRSGTRSRTTADLIRREKRGTFAFLSDFVSWLGVLRRIQEMIDQADLKYRAVDVLVVSLLATVAMWFVLGFFGLALLLLRLVIAVLIGAVPLFYILRMRRRRLSKFEENFPDAIDLFNRSMKAGHTIHSGLETIGTEAVEPVRMEFKKVGEELALGSPLEDALHNLARRVPVIDLKFFITGLVLQRQTGANMVEVLDNLALLVRERLNMMAKMKAHTAQQRLSAALLCAMPIVFAVGLWFVKPEYLTLLYTDSTGSFLLTYAIISELVGIAVIRKIANPRF